MSAMVLIIKRERKYLIYRYVLVILLFVGNSLSFQGLSQSINMEYEKFQAGDVDNHFSWIDLSPDNQTLVISSTQSFPVYLFDWKSRMITNRLDAGNWYAGSRIHYSISGRYLLLEQLYYLDFAPNKDREVNFEIVDAKTGRKVKSFENYHDVVISPDDKYAISLSSDQVSFWNLETGRKEGNFDVPDATNALAVSPDGLYLAVSHKTRADELKQDSRYKNNKKNLDILEKYKQQVSLYDAQTFQKLYTVDEFYDIIYRLTFSGDSKYLFCHSVPNTKLQKGSNPKEGYVSVIDVINKEPLRIIFPTTSFYFEPDFKMSHDMTRFALTSMGKFPEVRVYDFETGRMLYRFELAFRILDKDKGDKLPLDGRASFVFLPDDRSMMITFGNRLLLWQM